MGNKPDDRNDADWSGEPNLRKRRVGIWNPVYLKKFTSLLLSHPVLLQALQNYARNDPIHQSRPVAVAAVKEELGLSEPEFKQRMTSFRKYAGNKFNQYALKCGPQATPETILKTVPTWLRELEPHLSLWSRVYRNRSKDKPPPVPALTPEPAAVPDWVEGGARLLLALGHNARELRSLDAETVCRLDSVPGDRVQELKYVWWRFLHVVREKLSIQRDGGDAHKAARMSPVEEALADLILLLDHTISTLPDCNDYDCLQGLVALFHMAQLYRLELGGAGRAGRWRRALAAYVTRIPQNRGVCCSIVLLQRRWHELKQSTRRSLAEYTARQTPPSMLHAAIATRFPHIMTSPLPTWQELVESGAVIEDQQGNQSETASEAESEDLEADGEGVNLLLSPADFKQYQRTAKDAEDDLVLIEKEIETIDLINVADDRDNEQQRANTLTSQLERELDRQLRDMRDHSGASETELLSRPVGEPMFIYDSDSDVECTDKIPDIDLVEAESTSEDEDLSKDIKKELIDSCAVVEPASEEMETAQSADDDETSAFDEKLLMGTAVPLIRVDTVPEWARAAKRHRVDLTQLDLGRFSAKKPRQETLEPEYSVCLKTEDCETLDPEVKVKVEKVEEDSVNNVEKPKGRQVKSVARRLISEIMRDETEPEPRRRRNSDTRVTKKNEGSPSEEHGSPADFRDNARRDGSGAANSDHRVTKKIQLPNIDEVRKTNLSILTAQVAPLSPEGGVKKERKLSTDSSGALQIDEGGQIGETLSQSQLDQLLQRIANERAAISLPPTSISGTKHHCCTARRQRALNAARRRLAVSAGRMPPPFLDIHSTSICANANKCTCCCKHLLDGGESGARLKRAVGEVEDALRKLLGEDTPLDTEAKRYSQAKRPRASGKKTITTEQESEELDPFQEWQRQKTLNQKYFDLNLKKRTEETNVEPASTKSDVNKPVKLICTGRPSVTVKKDMKSFSFVAQTSGATTSQTPASQATTSQADQKNITFTTKMSAPSKFVKIQVPTTAGKMLNIFKMSEDKADPNQKTVETPIGKIVTKDNQKTLVLSASDQQKLVLAAHQIKLPSSSIGTVPLGKLVPIVSQVSSPIQRNPELTPFITTEKGNIILTPPKVKPGSSHEIQGRLIPVTLTQHRLTPSPKKILTKTSSEGKLPNTSLQGNMPNASPQATLSVTSTLKKLLPVTSSQARITQVSAVPTTSLQAKITQLSVVPTSSSGNVMKVSVVPTTSSQAKITQVSVVPTSSSGKVTKVSVVPTTSSQAKITQLSEMPTTSTQGKTVQASAAPTTRTHGNVISITSRQGKELCTTSPQGKLTPVNITKNTSQLTNASKGLLKLTALKAGAIKVTQFEKLLQRKGIVMRTSTQNASARPNQFQLANTANQIQVANIGDEIQLGKYAGKLELRPITGTFISRPVKIAPKPEETSGDQKEQGTSGQSGPRGTGMKQGAVPSGTPKGRNPKKLRFVVLQKDGSTKELVLNHQPDDHDTSPKQVDFRLDVHFKRKDLHLELDKYLLNKDPTGLTLLVFDDMSSYFTVQNFLVVSESELAFAAPSYWTLVPLKSSARVTPESNPSDVVAAPERMYPEEHRQVYIRLKNNPLLYAKALFVIRSASECHNELLRNSTLHMINVNGSMTPLSRSHALGTDQLALYSPNVEAAKMLACILNQLPSQPNAVLSEDTKTEGTKTGVNARADVVMMMNNVNRKPIEMVYVDSDDEVEEKVDEGEVKGEPKKEFNFKGLENFEDLDEFDL